MAAEAFRAVGALPCPFCGGTDLAVEHDAVDVETWDVQCRNDDCGCSGPSGLPTEADAIAAWNRRVPS